LFAEGLEVGAEGGDSFEGFFFFGGVEFAAGEVGVGIEGSGEGG
jgi:hypothetical protein